MTKPSLRRDIQLVTTVIDGRPMIMVMDPLQLAGNSFALDTKLLPLLRALDGKNDFRDIQMEMMRQQGGSLIPLSEIESFINELDAIFLLDSDLFRKKVTFLYEEYNHQRDRTPSHAGKCYDSNPDKLSEFIEEIENNILLDIPDYSDRHITGVLAPHIDVTVAKETYVNLYRRLKGKHYDLVIIFGINHQWQDGLYSISEKNFITPFGTLQTDKDFVAQLRERVPVGTLATNDYGHRLEHSIEFQTIFLHHYLQEPPYIVPILCGGIHEFIFNRKNFFADDRFIGMLETLNELIRAEDKKVLFVSGVDFSHIGLKFGHQMPANTILPLAQANDQRIISHILKGQSHKIFEGAMENQDQFQVCGLPSILIFSQLMEHSTGELLEHETYDERATKSAVTYASMIFTNR